jgi:hypothetical protein
MSTKRKRNSFSLKTKYKIIKLLDNQPNISDIISEFSGEGVTAKNVYQFKSQKEKIIKAYENSITSTAKSLKTCKYPDIDKALENFISNAVSNGLPINTLVLKEKASEFALKFGHKDFKASNGFIEKFKRRHDIIFETNRWEGSGVSEEVCNDWTQNKLPELLSEYPPEDVFNGDELGLFWRLTPDKSFTIRGQKFKNGKKSIERISVFICSNSIGTEKLKPIVIGKYKEPYCFRGKDKVPVIYKNNSKAWMTSEIFTDFLESLNKQMKKSDRKIVLIVDNCAAHPFKPLSNVRIRYLPPNTTSRLQPMDMGVIHTLKANYRRKLVRRMIAIFEAKGSCIPRDINLYEAIIMLSNAWNEMNPTVIRNCFKKCGFISNEEITTTIELIEDPDNSENDWNELISSLEIQQLEFNDFVNYDDNIETSDNSICDSNQTSNQTTDLCEEEVIDSDVHEDTDPEETIGLNDAILSVNHLRKYITQTNGSDICFDLLNKFENEIYKNRVECLKQSKITDYLNK